MSEKKMTDINPDVQINDPDDVETAAGAVAKKKLAQKPKENLFDPDKLADSIQSGELELKEPITDGDESYDKLPYDFRKLRGVELTRALDYGPGAKEAFNLTNTQALNYFACAAAKCQKPGGLDETDIRERIGPADAFKAIQIAQLFFQSSSQAGDRRFLRTQSKQQG